MAKPKTQLIDLRDPINSLPTEDRAALKELGLTGARGPLGKPRKALPKNWRERIAAVASRPHTAAEVAKVLGISIRTFFNHLSDPKSDVKDVYELARTLLHRRLITPIEASALNGEVEDAKWLLARLWPDVYGPGAINAPRTAVNVNVQNNFQLPKPLSAKEYAALFKPAIEGEVKPA